MTPQHPAAPEGETDASVRLTDLFDRAHDEVVRLCQPGESWRMSIPANPDRDSDLILSDALTKAAELAERLRVVEGERDAAVAESRYPEAERSYLSLEWERLAKSARARAESAEAAHAALVAERDALRSGIWALGESIHGDEGVEHVEGCEGEPTCFACILGQLRALLAGGGA